MDAGLADLGTARIVSVAVTASIVNQCGVTGAQTAINTAVRLWIVIRTGSAWLAGLLVELPGFV